MNSARSLISPLSISLPPGPPHFAIPGGDPHGKSTFFSTSFLELKMSASWPSLCAPGTPWANFQAPSGAPKGALRGRKTSFYDVKSTILMKTALTPKITIFLTFGSPASSEGHFWVEKRRPPIAQKATLGALRPPQVLKKRNFTMRF